MIGTGCGVSPVSGPPNGQNEKAYRVRCHPVMISDCEVHTQASTKVGRIILNKQLYLFLVDANLILKGLSLPMISSNPHAHSSAAAKASLRAVRKSPSWKTLPITFLRASAKKQLRRMYPSETAMQGTKAIFTHSSCT